jgi:ACR3 family arsenite transporter
MLAGFVTRRLGERRLGRERYERRVLPRLAPWALYGLLVVTALLFAVTGEAVTGRPGDVVRIALPLLVYFVLIWCTGFALGKGVGLPYERTAALAFTSAGNNFGLAVAVAIATFGATSGEVLAGVVGPLVEVPTLVGLVYVSLAWRRLSLASM